MSKHAKSRKGVHFRGLHEDRSHFGSQNDQSSIHRRDLGDIIIAA